MNNFGKLLLTTFSFILVLYTLLPTPSYPLSLPDSLQSDEPGDTEDPLRRSYFTNFSREEVMTHYKTNFSKSNLLGIPLPTYRLNYPPEEAQTIIRDQTRSTFLEEVVHPFRESVFINGFEPTEAKDNIFIGGKTWRQKITVRYVPSNTISRVLISLLTIGLTWIVLDQWRLLINKVNK